MTATQLRYRRYLKQTRSALTIAEIFQEYPQRILRMLYRHFESYFT